MGRLRLTLVSNGRARRLGIYLPLLKITAFRGLLPGAGAPFAEMCGTVKLPLFPMERGHTRKQGG